MLMGLPTIDTHGSAVEKDVHLEGDDIVEKDVCLEGHQGPCRMYM